jgi:hypothetical protein
LNNFSLPLYEQGGILPAEQQVAAGVPRGEWSQIFD